MKPKNILLTAALAICGFAILTELPCQAQFTWRTNADNTIMITTYTGSGVAVVTIPDTITGLPVTGIGNSAFWDKINVVSVTIPNTVISIGDEAFGICTFLTNVTFGNGLLNIGNFAFNDCLRLTNVFIPNSVTNIGTGAFTVFWLTNITIGNGVTSIGDNAFAGDDYLLSAYFTGNAPSFVGSTIFQSDNNTTVYYLPGTTGWGPTFGGRPTALWLPQVQTRDINFGVRTNQFGFTISWASGQNVVVEASTDLTNPTWLPLATNTLTSGSVYFSDPQWSNYPARFYRIRSP